MKSFPLRSGARFMLGGEAFMLINIEKSEFESNWYRSTVLNITGLSPTTFPMIIIYFKFVITS